MPGETRRSGRPFLPFGVADLRMIEPIVGIVGNERLVGIEGTAQVLDRVAAILGQWIRHVDPQIDERTLAVRCRNDEAGGSLALGLAAGGVTGLDGTDKPLGEIDTGVAREAVMDRIDDLATRKAVTHRDEPCANAMAGPGRTLGRAMRGSGTVDRHDTHLAVVVEMRIIAREQTQDLVRRQPTRGEIEADMAEAPVAVALGGNGGDTAADMGAAGCDAERAGGKANAELPGVWVSGDNGEGHIIPPLPWRPRPVRSDVATWNVSGKFQ
ncbi:hypothetical protein CHELA1G2_20416 [Hyphomicrobiales bacterium]|nr:hypothetical protein CHELA1G2_20416 [Hyphomicrobiales bacterium]